MFFFRNHLFFFGIGGLLLFSSGCIPLKQARVAAVGLTMQDVATAASRQSNLAIVREGTPAYLMLMEGLLEASPGNAELLLGACRAYNSYTSAFVPEDQTEEAAALYRKARGYGLRALSASAGVDMERAASGSLDDFKAALQKLDRADVPELFCAVSAWAGWIGSDITSIEALSDLPLLEASMRRVLALDESFEHGSPHILMGVYMAARPAAMGGSLEESKNHFDRAFVLGARKVLMARVLFAQYYARGISDRVLYESTLNGVLSASADEIPELTFMNVVAKKKAEMLLERTEEYFEDPFAEKS